MFLGDMNRRPILTISGEKKKSLRNKMVFETIVRNDHSDSSKVSTAQDDKNRYVVVFVELNIFWSWGYQTSLIFNNPYSI
jgi:hypothetical protein